ncbi:hypothetical protein [Streptomyces sp. NPDC056105]|uniref:hypothetical protein n=1 Tax=Streptomyces sp. NPDC056105 TaxID=3345714 RepID=UPI0035E246C5
MASHGTVPWVSASTTAAPCRAPMARAASASRRNLMRNSGSRASSSRTVFRATTRPPAVRARNTVPMPPLPSRPSNV